MIRTAPDAPAGHPSSIAARRWHEPVLVAGIVGVAALLRAWHPRAGVPFAVGVDEPAIVDRALRILRTGDWNTHVFDYPTLVIYLHAIVAAAAFVRGALHAWWSSLAAFDIGAVYEACRLAAAAIGAVTVWLTFRLGRALGGPAVGLLAAMQLAVLPMHVRESHFVLTDAPVTALVVLAVWLTVGAGERRTLPLWAAAGAVAGLAAAAKYNGGIALVAVLAGAFVHERTWRCRGTAVIVAAVAAAAGFLLAAPYTVLDLPHFLDGFAAQMSRFSIGPPAAEPVWRVYLKHLALNGWAWLPFAALGMAFALRTDWRRAVAPLAFVGAYSYVLATHSIVFGRYALPLTPFVCVFAALGAVAVADAIDRRARVAPRQRTWLVVGAALVLTAGSAARTVQWLGRFDDADTRRSAGEWMQAALPRGARVAVDVTGPTYLDRAGFVVTAVPRLPQDADWYRRRRVEFAVLAWREEREGPRPLGHTLFEIAPTPRRWGPSLRVVRIDPAPVVP